MFFSSSTLIDALFERRVQHNYAHRQLAARRIFSHYFTSLYPHCQADCKQHLLSAARVSVMVQKEQFLNQISEGICKFPQFQFNLNRFDNFPLQIFVFIWVSVVLKVSSCGPAELRTSSRHQFMRLVQPEPANILFIPGYFHLRLSQ